MQDSVQQSINQQSESLPEMSRLEYLLRVHWLGRLVSLALLSVVIYVPFSFLWIPFPWHASALFAVGISNLLLSPWFGLGTGGLLGLRLSRHNLRIALISFMSVSMITLASIAAIRFTHVLAFPTEYYVMNNFLKVVLQFVLPYFLLAFFLEALFRGILLKVLSERLGWAQAALITALLNGAAMYVYHFQHPQAVANTVVIGFFLAFVVLRSGSLWFAIVFQFVFGFLDFFSRQHAFYGLPDWVRLRNLEILDSWAWLSWFVGDAHVGAVGSVLFLLLVNCFALLFVPRLEHLRDPVLAARDFRRRLRESKLAAVHGFRA